ncbi:MAG: hypothetical protein ABIZ34_05050 [Candidatus Limnocylindrales bacterium]
MTGPVTVLLAIAAVALVLVVWALLRRARGRRDSGVTVMSYGTPPSPMPMPMPNTLTPMSGISPTQTVTGHTLPGQTLPGETLPGQIVPGAMTVISGGTVGSIDPAFLQQLAQMGMAIAGQVQSGHAFPQGSVDGMQPTVIDLRGAMTQQHQQQLAAGFAGSPVNGHAIIGAARDLGVAVDGQQLMELDLDVRPDGMAAYPLTQRVLVPAAETSRAVGGGTLPVHVMAGAPTMLLIDWAG